MLKKEEIKISQYVFKSGDFFPVLSGLGSMAYIRKDKDSEILIATNRWCCADTIEIPERFAKGEVLYGNNPDGTNLTIDAYDFAIIKI